MGMVVPSGKRESVEQEDFEMTNGMRDDPTGPLAHSPYVPFEPGVGVYDLRFGYVHPMEYRGWKEEVLSWKQTAYLHGGLNPTPTLRIWGPDALRLLSEHCVNGFATFPVGGAKHAVMCNDDGHVMVHGVLVRLGEEEFITYWLMPWISYLVDSGKYDVQCENLTGKVFLFQLAGPRSLEILEAATGDDLRDIRFLRQRGTTIAGSDVTVGSSQVDVLRLGMAGSLAYELHGPIERAHAVYAAIMEAGKPFGLERLGRAQYNMNHTENGFPQGFIHFLHPWSEDEQFEEYRRASGTWFPQQGLRGSVGEDLRARYRTPVELGWSHIIKFDHEFQGRAALEHEVANPRRTMVTLAWNADDVLDVYRSHFEPGTEYQYMAFHYEPMSHIIPPEHFADLVLKDGRTVGISSGRTYSYYYRQMISLCSIDVADSALGTEVEVVWGAPGTRQKHIRATVERFPFYDENRNEHVDVTTLPRGAGGQA